MPEPITEYTPLYAHDGGRARRAAWAAWVAALSGALLFAGLIVAAPLLRARGLFFLSQAIYQGFHAACHQMPERSFHLWGFPLAVCARCFGLYAGLLAGVVIYPLARPLMRADAPHRRWLFAAALPTSVDFVLGLLGVWENTHGSRFVTALLLGAVSAFYVVPGIVGLAHRYWPRHLRPAASS
ncbi:MAG: hypothetical protein QOD42_1580 [Sphingomonadales bacterium]|jgi:uncharacterized membrane protein|nr:hypothetical protein [Sphingomonadales bacterium]